MMTLGWPCNCPQKCQICLIWSGTEKGLSNTSSEIDEDQVYTVE